MNGRTKARMESHNNAAYKRWVGAEWWEEGYERLWLGGPTSENGDVRTENATNDEAGKEAESAEGAAAEVGSNKRSRRKHMQPSSAEKTSVVYLTADTEDELTELKEDETYIIGGIVDHNRYKVSRNYTQFLQRLCSMRVSCANTHCTIRVARSPSGCMC